MPKKKTACRQCGKSYTTEECNAHRCDRCGEWHEGHYGARCTRARPGDAWNGTAPSVLTEDQITNLTNMLARTDDPAVQNVLVQHIQQRLETLSGANQPRRGRATHDRSGLSLLTEEIVTSRIAGEMHVANNAAGYKQTGTATPNVEESTSESKITLATCSHFNVV